MDKYILSVIFHVFGQEDELLGYRSQTAFFSVQEISHDNIEVLHLAIDSTIRAMIEDAQKDWPKYHPGVPLPRWTPVSHSIVKE
jgi:hypothetical protein